MAREQRAVRAGERAQVLEPVVGRRRRLEAAEHAVEQRRDELLLGREVVVERHRHGAEAGGDGAHAERVEALLGDRLGGVEDHLAAERSALASGPGVRLARVFRHGP